MPRPDSLPWMESVDAKVRRARVHLDDFRASALKWSETARPTFIRKTNHERTSHWLVFYVQDPHPPIELSVVVGDFLHNLRSALDSLVCGLVRRMAPSSTCSGRQFPIFTDPDKYLAARNQMLRGVSPEARTIVDALQPHMRPEGTRALDPLWILNTLNNHDKHRTTHLTLCCNKNLELLIPLKNGALWRVRLDRDYVAGDVSIVPLHCEPALVADDSDGLTIHVSGRTVLLFRLDEPFADRPVDQLLEACLRYVEDHVIVRFRPLFS